MSSVSHSAAAFSSTSASDLLRSSSNGFRGLPLRTLGRARLATLRRDFTVTAKLRKVKKDRPWPEDPDPNVKGGILTHLSYFKPLKEKPKPAILDFEKPLLDLEKKIADVKKMADDTGLDFSDQILSLENKYQQALKHLYTHLTPIQRVYIARHPNRPTFLDHIFNITDKFLELHGDRQGYDDPAIVTGLGTIDGRTFMFIGHQKGRNTKENIQRNFGMPTPHGYRKALRLMRYADHHGFPIVTFIDTPGAFADLKSEELGQGEAIAQNLRSMFGLKVPIISIVIGEGGSGGALAIGCANKLLMLENAVFYVASPEACAAILWKSAKAAPEAARRLKITARELYKLKIADGVIPEPLGGAHTDPERTSNKIKAAINKAMDELTKMDTEQLLKHRALKFRNIGGFQEGIPIDPRKKRNMKKREKAIDQKDLNEELGAEVEKLKEQVLKAVESSEKPPEQALSDMIEKLKTQVDHEFDLAFEAVGLKDARDSLKKSLSKMRAKQKTLTPVLKNKILKLDKVFNERAPRAPNYANLMQKYDLLKELYWAQSLCDDARVQAELNEKWKDVVEYPDVKEKVEELKAVIQNSGASKFDDFDQELKGKIVKIKKDLEMDVNNVYRSMGFDKQNIKINLELPGEVERLSALNRRHDILSEETQKKIEEVLESSELQDMSESLELEVEKAGEEPDEAAASKIDALTEQILERLSEALRSAGLEEEWEKLEAEIDDGLRDSYALDGSLEVSESEEPRKLKAENEEALSNSDASDGSLEVSEYEEPRVEVNLDA